MIDFGAAYLRRVTVAALAGALGLAGFVGGASAQEAPVRNSAAASPQSRVQTPATAPAPPPVDHLFGDWDGFRKRLADRGVTFTLNYTTETAGNVSGGLRQGATYAHQIGLSVDIDWQTFAQIQGFKTHAIFINRAGNSVSSDYVGDTVLAGQEIYGAGFGQIVKLVWLYGEQSLMDDRLKITFGRFAPGLDYAASPLYCSFMTLTICGHPRALTANQGFVDWPLSEWGAEVKGRLTGDTYISVGAFQSQPFPTDAAPYTQGGHSGFDWTFKGTTGVSIPIEVGYEPLVGPQKLPGHYKVGVNFDSSDYADNFSDGHGLPIALTGLAGRKHEGRTQVWATADQMVWQHGDFSDDGLYLLGAYAHDDPDTSFFDNFYWAGLIDRGFMPGRPNDQIGFGVTYFEVSPSLTRTERLQQSIGAPLAGGANGIQTHGTVYELNYGFKAGPGVQIQPELEYFSRPGGTGSVPSAFLVGLKTNIDF